MMSHNYFLFGKVLFTVEMRSGLINPSNVCVLITFLYVVNILILQGDVICNEQHHTAEVNMGQAQQTDVM